MASGWIGSSQQKESALHSKIMKVFVMSRKNKLPRWVVLLLCTLAIIFAQTLTVFDSSAHAMGQSSAVVAEDADCINTSPPKSDDSKPGMPHVAHCAVHCFHAQSAIGQYLVLDAPCARASRLLPTDSMAMSSAILARIKQPPKA